MIIVFKTLDDFLKALNHYPFILHDLMRSELYVLHGSHVLLYKLKDRKELDRAKKEKIVIPAVRVFTLNPDSVADLERAEKEFKEVARKLIGKKIKELKMGDEGIDIVLEDGTTLEIYCFGEWGWIVEKEDQDRENEALL